jgi:hypothetical protein
MVARALFIAAIALFCFSWYIFYIAKVVQPGSWIGETLLIAAFLLIAAGGFASVSNKER